MGRVLGALGQLWQPLLVRQSDLNAAFYATLACSDAGVVLEKPSRLGGS